MSINVNIDNASKVMDKGWVNVPVIGQKAIDKIFANVNGVAKEAWISFMLYFYMWWTADYTMAANTHYFDRRDFDNIAQLRKQTTIFPYTDKPRYNIDNDGNVFVSSTTINTYLLIRKYDNLLNLLATTDFTSKQVYSYDFANTRAMKKDGSALFLSRSSGSIVDIFCSTGLSQVVTITRPDGGWGYSKARFLKLSNDELKLFVTWEDRTAPEGTWIYSKGVACYDLTNILSPKLLWDKELNAQNSITNIQENPTNANEIILTKGNLTYLYVYNSSTGNLIQTINNLGEAINGWNWDIDNDYIYVFKSTAQKVSVYDFMLNFIKDIPVSIPDFRAMIVSRTSNDIYIRKGNYTVCRYDKNMNLLQTLSPSTANNAFIRSFGTQEVFWEV